MNYILEYFQKIQSGEIVASKKIHEVYEQLSSRILSPESNSKYVFNEKKANKPIKFIEKFCRHSKGELAGKPLKLELFQKAFISALYGFVERDTGKRQYKECLFYVARKNGKSVLLSGLALYELIGDGEPGAEVYVAASKKDQARIVFTETLNMIMQNSQLTQVLKKRKSDIYFPLTMSKFQALGRNSDTLDGLNASCVIIDELHSIRDRNTYEVLRQAQSARRQPLLIMITTAGTIRENIFDDMHKYAVDVLEGAIEDEHFLPIMYELDSKEELFNPECWIKANPGIGTIKKKSDLQEKVLRAKQSPKDLSGILCKDFNVITNSAASWLTYDDINNPETFDISQFKGTYGIGGADLSKTTDLTCATLLIMDKNEKKYVTQMYFLPEENFNQRIQEEKLPYDKWKEQGLLRLCQGNQINYSDVTAWFKEVTQQLDITLAWVLYDPYSAAYWVQEMESEGFRMEKCIQGFKTLSLPMQKLGADLQAKQINYNNNPMLKWCLSNTGVKSDVNGNIMPIKCNNPKYRIDGTASLLDAYVGLCEHYQEYLNAI